MSDVTIADIIVGNGQRQRIDLPVARLPTQTQMTLPIEVVNGRREGPRLWLSAALHGDELNGVEIIQRVLDKLNPRTLRGELVAIPIVNIFGFINQQRYLPDGRDLNRCFPGSASGSLASRLAHLFMTQIVAHCSHGIDLHTGGAHRTNLPQVRCDLDDPEARRMAEAFAAPIMIHGESPAGSLRSAVAKRGKPILVYEAGESHRFNSDAINVGVKGVLRVMGDLGMIKQPDGGRRRQSMEASNRTWIRARRSGILRLQVKLGRSVTEGQPLGVIRDAFGDDKYTLTSPGSGLVIGLTNCPLVHEGDGIIHLALDVTTHRV
ncbi:succinylglutamate desuccinylase/aspartoacylase family protein [Planctomycetales bacterium ZRK34]|nr:succinylglutamate desuccinylase/aspartoacylase family protein [Planctomycetales bacterium ZRK34]